MSRPKQSSLLFGANKIDTPPAPPPSPRYKNAPLEEVAEEDEFDTREILRVIISEKPKMKIVRDYFKLRVEELQAAENDDI